MTDKNSNHVPIDLNESQKIQPKHAPEKDAESVELEAQELEQRIAPRGIDVEF